MQLPLILLCLTSLTGCGSTCDQLAAARKAQLEGGAPDRDLPHLILDLPAPLLERHFDAALAEIEPVKFKLDLGPLSGAVGKLNLRAKQIRLLEAPPGALRFALTFSASKGRDPLFDLTAEAEVKPTLKGQQIAFKIGPQHLRRVEPQISREATAAILRLVKRKAGSTFGSLVPKKQARKLINAGLRRLSKEALPLLRDKVLKRAVKATTFAFALPEALPLERLELQSLKGKGRALRLALWTKLPVTEGIAKPPKPGRRLTARISGAAVAALANAAIARGDLPGRFTMKGKPKADGPFEAHLGWRAEEDRPLKLEAWRLGGDCVRATLGARPKLEVVEGAEGQAELKLSVEDPALEDLEGPALLSLGAWFASLWSGAPEISKKITAEAEFELGSRPLKLSLKRASLDASLDLDFDLEPKR